MFLVVLAFTFLSILEAEKVLQNRPGIIDAKLDTIYNGTVKNGIEDIYFFNLTNSKLSPNGVRNVFFLKRVYYFQSFKL